MAKTGRTGFVVGGVALFALLAIGSGVVVSSLGKTDVVREAGTGETKAPEVVVVEKRAEPVRPEVVKAPEPPVVPVPTATPAVASAKPAALVPTAPRRPHGRKGKHQTSTKPGTTKPADDMGF